jgi:hypothetical protein
MRVALWIVVSVLLIAASVARADDGDLLPQEPRLGCEGASVRDHRLTDADRGTPDWESETDCGICRSFQDALSGPDPDHLFDAERDSCRRCWTARAR